MPAPGQKLQTLPLKRKIELIDTIEKRPAGKKKKEIALKFDQYHTKHPVGNSTTIRFNSYKSFQVNLVVPYIGVSHLLHSKESLFQHFWISRISDR